MKTVVRVVEGPLPTDDQGRAVVTCVSWFNESSPSPRFYGDALVNGARPEHMPVLSPKQRLIARAEEVLKENRTLFVTLA